MDIQDPYIHLFIVIATYAVVCVVAWLLDPLRSIPTVGGPSAPILSFRSTVNFIFRGRDLILEGYQRYYGSMFRVAFFDRWLVIISGPKLVDEILKLPDDEASFMESAEEFTKFQYTLGRATIDDPYHVDIIRETLMRALPVILPGVIEELTTAVPYYIPTMYDEWVMMTARPTVRNIIARASNRAFVGIPLCRNQEYLDLAINFTLDAIKDRTVMFFVPPPLRQLVSKLTNRVMKNVRMSTRHLKPLLDKRRAMMEELGDRWDDRPDDMLQSILEEAIARHHTDEEIAARTLLMNFGALHTTSNMATHALYDLAAHPEWLIPLREEIEPIIATEGWTRAAFGKMRKLDSLLKESQRFHGVNLVSVTRITLKDMTLSNGTFIPKNTLIAAAAHPTHHDEALYPNAEVFDPFRFADMREQPGESMKHQFVKTSLEYIAFGHGKHACPGRFFAANVLKALLAFVIVNYDLKVAGDGKRPRTMYFGPNVIPSPNGQLMFRRRQKI